MRFLYKPFGLIASLLGARLGQKAFKSIWARIDDAEPPEPTTGDVNAGKAIGAKALQAATVAAVGAAVDRTSARVFHYLTGSWPGKAHQEPAEN